MATCGLQSTKKKKKVISNMKILKRVNIIYHSTIAQSQCHGNVLNENGCSFMLLL